MSENGNSKGELLGFRNMSMNVRLQPLLSQIIVSADKVRGNCNRDAGKNKRVARNKIILSHNLHPGLYRPDGNVFFRFPDLKNREKP